MSETRSSRRYRRGMFTLTFLAWFAIRGSRILLAPVVPGIRETFGVTNGAVGGIVTAMTVGYALTQFAGGVLGDRFGERRVIVLALLASGAGSLSMALAPSFVAFGVFALVLGGGGGLYRAPAESFLEATFTDADAVISGHAAGGAVAGILTPSVAVALTGWGGWRWAVAVGGVAAVVVGVPFWAASRRARPGETDHEWPGVATMRAFFTSRAMVYTTALGTLGTFAFEAFLTFFPTFLTAYGEFTPETAGIAFGVASAAAVVGLFAAGRIAGRWLSRDATLVAVFGSKTLGVGILLAAPNGPIAWLGVIALGVGLSWSGLVAARFLDVAADEGRGSTLGLHKSVGLLAGSSGSLVVGRVADAFGWDVGFALVGGVPLIVAVSLLVVTAAGLDV